ncbi:hypothetical protein NUM_33490 [Actinocatenispora comari]|jgi:putative transposase|uniref:Transposase IS200-like domain-containing protein n=1 Tax=Actinocatenispora comari TaxID=2807577 RepID=A0A8J4ACC9_9ACTN|nr:hypothetical protein NUM_33490 [Actinocatenispora comari]
MDTHLVFVSKFRHKVFTVWHLTRMEAIMRHVCAGFQAELVEFNGENEHVPLLGTFPPKMAVARLVNSLKGVSSRHLRQEFPDLVRHYYQANKLWSGSYFAGSVGGAPLSAVKHLHPAAEPSRIRHCPGPDGPPSSGPHSRPEGRSTGPHPGSGCSGTR